MSVMLKPKTPRVLPPSYNCCTDSRKGACAPGHGVPINQLNRCVQCDQRPLLGWITFILIQLLPVTVIVFIIIVFNIQLTNGFMIGLVFYFQMISIVYPNLNLNIMFEVGLAYDMHNYDTNCLLPYPNLHVIPGNLFNLNFLMFF